MSFLETIAAIIAFVVIVGLALIPLELISRWEERVHDKKRK